MRGPRPNPRPTQRHRRRRLHRQAGRETGRERYSRPKAHLCRRHLQWRRHGNDARSRPRRSVCGRCERESHRRGHGYLPRPRPMLIINGTADPLVPHEARIELFCRGRFLIDGGDAGLLAQAQRLRDRRRCGDRHADRGPADQSTVTRRRRRARSPQPGRPPHARLLSRCALPEDRGSPLGPQNADIDGAETIWMCFSRFPSGRACFAGNACVPGVAQHSALG